MISAPFVLLAILLGIIWVVAVYDWRTHTIPNYFPIAVIVLFLLASPFSFETWQGFGLQGLAFIIAFALGLVLYIAGPMGGGDIKLFAALGLWITLPDLLSWILCVTLSGLCLTILFIVIRVTKLRTNEELALSDAYKQVRTTEIPYGPAITLGTTILFLIKQPGLL